jgi:hypothetical protein
MPSIQDVADQINNKLDEIVANTAATATVGVGWSDTAFYPDPRAREDDAGNVTSWERAQTRLTVEPRRRRRRGSQPLRITPTPGHRTGRRTMLPSRSQHSALTFQCSTS